MAGIETYGGACPKCLKGMEQKHESSWSGFIFDACPWCGYINVGESITKEEEEETWKSILEHCHVETKEELIQRYNHPMYTPDENKEFFPSLWNALEQEDTTLMYKLLWWKYANRTPEKYSISGLRVYWGDEKEKQGTLMEYKEGAIFILWDEHKGSKLGNFEYPGTDLGKKIHLVEPFTFENNEQ
jgi:hypothetical protein